MLKKIFKMAKKAAPVIGAGLGFLYGGPMLGSAIGGGLGSLVAGKSPEEALKFAALSGLTGGALSKFGGLQAGQGLAGLGLGGGQTAAAVGPNQLAAQTMQQAGVKNLAGDALAKQSLLSKGLGWAKANPKTAAVAALLGGGALAGGLGGDEEEIDMIDYTGTMAPFRDLGNASTIPVQTVPYSNYSHHFAGGGIADANYFPRRTGAISGPGTEVSDEVPAMLSDGEFVVNAKTVRGLGSMLGGNNRNDQRNLGAKFFYDLQNNYGVA